MAAPYLETERLLIRPLDQPGVGAVLAETETPNISSDRSLLKNGFTVYLEVDNMLWWILSVEYNLSL